MRVGCMNFLFPMKDCAGPGTKIAQVKIQKVQATD
jgi:hypothetical protein